MNPWIAALIGAGVMYVIGCVVTAVDEYWLDDIFVTPANFLFMVVSFPFVIIYGLFRHMVIPVDRQKNPFVQEVIDESWKIAPGLYFHHDKKAKRVCNKFFFFRLAKED